MRIVTSVLAMGALLVGLTGGVVSHAEAALVTQLDFTGGAVSWNGPHERKLERLFDREGTIKMGEYQGWSDIVDPISRGRKSFSLFTSGVFGAPAPSATIHGNSITLDLSSLFFGMRRGDELRAWNIGGQAKGLFNPETSEFCLSWKNLFDDRSKHKFHENVGTFFLQGKAIVGTPAAVAIPASVFLYGTGLFGVGSWTWLKRRRQQQLTVA